MDLDGLLDSGEPEQQAEPVGWAALKVFGLTLVVLAIGGTMLAFFLYLTSIGLIAAWSEFWEGF